MNFETENSVDENHIIKERQLKLLKLREQGFSYPNNFKPNAQMDDLHQQYGAFTREGLEKNPITVRVAGRMMFKRLMGKASFAKLQDASGEKLEGHIQLYIADDVLGHEEHEIFKHHDIGDVLGAEGVLFKTKTDELSIKVKELQILSKSLRPLPDKFHGLSDHEIRYRQRYLDLIMNAKTRQIFKMRTDVIRSIRGFMEAQDFLEVETPMLHPIPGGANAKPFTTYHHALDMPMYLRIAPELYLKRLIVGGLPRVFEINRNFRNEGISTRHNPEFTMMEFYAAYTDYQWLMDFTENLLRETVLKTAQTMHLPYQGQNIDFEKPFARYTITEAIAHYTQYKPEQLQDTAFLREELTRLRVPMHDPKHAHIGLGGLQLLLFEETAESQLIQPTFIIDYPREVSPLARLSNQNPEITERFELFIAGREIANGFSELNDPEDQATRFNAQAKGKDAGDEEAMYFDEEYIRALEYGMPPTGGCGIGIDRLLMLLSDSANIRDVILFPQMRLV